MFLLSLFFFQAALKRADHLEALLEQQRKQLLGKWLTGRGIGPSHHPIPCVIPSTAQQNIVILDCFVWFLFLKERFGSTRLLYLKASHDFDVPMSTGNKREIEFSVIPGYVFMCHGFDRRADSTQPLASCTDK